MSRPIQGLEDLHHGFPVERVGQRHRGFAFETVTGAPAITWGDFEEVFDAGHSGTYLSGHNTRGWPSEAMQQSLSPARRNHSLPPCVDAIDEALPIDSGTYPVSYTHLDVYKRQLRKGFASQDSGVDNHV